MTDSTSSKIDWPYHIQAWRDSGLTQNAYCEHHQLRPNQLTYWKHKLAGKSIKKSSTKKMIPVRLSSSAQAHVKITLPNGMVLEPASNFSPSSLAALVECLRNL